MKRSELKRKTPMRRSELRASGPARATVRVAKYKCKAPGCPEKFVRTRDSQILCPGSVKCAMAWLDAEKAKEARKAEKIARRLEAEGKRKDREKREALKNLPKLKTEAQEEFNRYVRLRDNGKGCFVCGVTLRLGGIGGGFDAGHIRSRSNADNLRFDERNVHGQCKRCNASGATKDWEMRGAAIRLLGPEAAEALYNDNAPVKWTRDGLREIRDTYRARANALEKAAK